MVVTKWGDYLLQNSVCLRLPDFSVRLSYQLMSVGGAIKPEVNGKPVPANSQMTSTIVILAEKKIKPHERHPLLQVYIWVIASDM